MDGLSQEPLLDHSQADAEGSEKEGTAVSTTAGGSLPKFNNSRTREILCIIGLTFTWLAVIGCLVAAVLVIKVPGVHFLKLVPLSTTTAEALSFTINILVGVVTDGLGFIHGTSLRHTYKEEFDAKEKPNKKGARLESPLSRLQQLSLQASFSLIKLTYTFNIPYIRVFVYSIVAIVLAVFATYLAFQKPKGPQPAAWGHLQTLADLVDDWRTDEDGSLWWGDKGPNEDDTRHAGTSADGDTLGEIQMDAEYEGI